MMAYSGARVGEVAQLCADEFFIIEGHWCYELTTKGRKSLKNEYSIRKIAIHPDLISECLLKFVHESGQHANRRLFKPSAQQDL